MGIVLNRPSETEVDEVAPELARSPTPRPVFVGGPVQPQALVVLAEFNDPGRPPGSSSPTSASSPPTPSTRELER